MIGRPLGSEAEKVAPDLRRRISPWPHLAWLVLCAFPLPFPALAGQPPSTDFYCGRDLLIAPGETASRDQLVVLGSITVSGMAGRDVSVVGGSVLVSGEVLGSVTVLGGSVTLEEGGVIRGDVVTLGGSVRQAAAGQVRGKVTAIGSAPRFLGLPGVPAAGEGGGGGPGRGLRARLILLLGWLVVTLAVTLAFPGQVVFAAGELGRRPLRNGLLGLLGLASLSVSLAASLLLALVLVGLPLLLLFFLAGLLLKMFGLVAVFHLTGRRLLRLLGPREPNPLAPALLGFTLLGLLRLVPFLGPWIWLLASVLGIGVSLSTKFGSGEPWLRRPRALSSL